MGRNWRKVTRADGVSMDCISTYVVELTFGTVASCPRIHVLVWIGSEPMTGCVVSEITEFYQGSGMRAGIN
jgi:hypothetical protein